MPNGLHLRLLGLLPLLSAVAVVGPALAADVAPVRAEQLERLVRHDCGSCHGMTLKGGLGPDIGAEKLSGAAPEAIAQIILNGVPDTPMPPWRPLLSDDEALWIANYLLKGTAK